MRHYQRLDRLAAQLRPATRPPRCAGARSRQDWGSTIVTGLIAFLVIYFTWGMVADDLIAYGRASWDQYDPEADQPPAGGQRRRDVDHVRGGRVRAAARCSAASRSACRSGSAGISAYLEAAWLLTAALALRDILEGVPQWLASRRMFALDRRRHRRVARDVRVVRRGRGRDRLGARARSARWSCCRSPGSHSPPSSSPACSPAADAVRRGRSARLREAAERRWRRVPRPLPRARHVAEQRPPRSMGADRDGAVAHPAQRAGAPRRVPARVRGRQRERTVAVRAHLPAARAPRGRAGGSRRATRSPCSSPSSRHRCSSSSSPPRSTRPSGASTSRSSVQTQSSRKFFRRADEHAAVLGSPGGDREVQAVVVGGTAADVAAVASTSGVGIRRRVRGARPPLTFAVRRRRMELGVAGHVVVGDPLGSGVMRRSATTTSVPSSTP